MRDHLFVSYATEDWSFVEWLVLRLTAEGYKVWCDRIKLLGGESYPNDIDAAIKNRTFRFIAVLSRHSLTKPNPLKERTLALGIAKERKENFLIPLNIDGSSPTDIGWMLSDLTYIPFHFSWASGLAQLLKKLDESNAPKEFVNGRSAAAAWFDAKGLVVPKEERLWANVSEITEMPADIYRYEMDGDISDEQRLELFQIWPHTREGQILWSFDTPPGTLFDKYRIRERGKITNWRAATSKDIDIRNTATRVLNDSLRSHCLSRGLKLTPSADLCYFPDGLLPNNRLSFVSYDNTHTWVKATGIRNFRTLTGSESCRYHLAPSIRVWLKHELGDLVQIRVRLFLTSTDGTPLEEKPALRKRKRICRNWWNYEWVSRTLAVFQFLANDAPALQIGKRESQRFVISKLPLTLQIPWGLDETLLKLDQPESEEADTAVLELDDKDEPEEQEGAGNE
jgi:hypothetical protein